MRGIRAWLPTAAISLVLGGASASGAQALEVHRFAGSFGTEGTGSGQFKRPAGIAVNNVTEDVYVVDKGNNRVEKFDARGSTPLAELTPPGGFSKPTEIAVDNSTNPLDPSAGDVYVIDSGHGVIDKFDASGTFLTFLNGSNTPGGMFSTGEGEPRSIVSLTTGIDGAVWIGLQSGTIYHFGDQANNELLSIPSEPTTQFGSITNGLGVDSENDLYVNVGGREFVKVTSLGETLAAPFSDDGSAQHVAVDSVGQKIYLDNGNDIEDFNFAGEPLESCLAGSTRCFGSGQLTNSAGVAVDTGSGLAKGTVYATSEASNSVSIFEAFSLPTVVVQDVSEQGPRSLTISGTVNPEGQPVTSCFVEYGTTTTYGNSVPCTPASVGAGTTAVPVSAHLEGLTPQTGYHYRLVAGNAGGENASADQEVFTGPKLGEGFATAVSTESATLHATINPNGGKTAYYVEYGPTTAYGSYAPILPPGVELGAGGEDQSVEVHIQHLVSGINYHYRFVSLQAGETFEGGDREFRTQGESVEGAEGLSDGRGWELVSPANKKGALIELFEMGGDVQAASNGSGVTYLTEGPAVGKDPAGKVTYSQALSRRAPDGTWGSVDLTLPGRLLENGESLANSDGYQPEYHLFSPNLDLAAVEPQSGGTPPLAAGVTERTLYLRDNIAEGFAPLVTPANSSAAKIEEANYGNDAASDWQMHILAVTPDLSNVVFKTPMALTPEAIDEEHVGEAGYVPNQVQSNIYEADAGGLKLVNILPGAAGKVAHGRAPKIPLVRLAGTNSVNGLGRGGAQRAVSDDGRRVAWTWGEPYGPELPKYLGLYVRDMVEKRTVRVGGADAFYQTMNASGTKIFFLENGDLYVYNFESRVQMDLTEHHGLGESSGEVQESVSDVSEDGSYVYYVAHGVLAAGGVKGEDNLYLSYESGGEWKTVFVALLGAEDKPDWYAQNFTAPNLARVSSRVSSDGRYLAFMSDRPLTGYDNVDAISGQRDEEVFLYHAPGEAADEAGSLVCASCDPTGARPAGQFDSELNPPLLVDRAGVWTGKENSSGDPHSDHWLAGSIPGWDALNSDPPTYQPRYLEDSGRLFFDSPVALVPQDTNGLQDVYEYEPAGLGDCAPGMASGTDVYVAEVAGHAVDGCVGLLSSGTSSAESAFYDASETGDDVFFATTGKLVGEDYDNGYDVYDAHVCSAAVPCRTVPVSPPPCTSGDSCKAASSPQPAIFGPAPTTTFSGTGNVRRSVTPKALTVVEKRNRAFAACRKIRKKGKRKACERSVRKRYPLKSAKKSNLGGRSSASRIVRGK
jgi:hypothetical protein